MGTSAQAGKAPATDGDAFERLLAWVKRHQQASIWVGVVIVVGAGMAYWNILSARQSEFVAGNALGQARLAFESGNFPLAASELGQITANYSGTNAAQQANLLLAQSRLRQGQAQQAVDLLAKFAPSARSAYQAQAYGLLGDALENLGHPRDAGVAYRSAADHAEMPFMRAQSLSDAGRAFSEGGDTAQATSAYAEIVMKLDSTPNVAEAKVRLGELTRGTWKPSK